MIRRSSLRHAGCAAIVLLTTHAVPAQAITIELEFLEPGDAFSLKTSTRAQAAPSATGQGGFEQVVSDAAAIWEDLVDDPGLLRLSVGWADLAPGRLAQAVQRASRDYGGRGKVGDLQFSTRFPWFFDDDPSEHGEYAQQSTQRADLGAGSMITGVSYSGALGPALGAYDLFTVALHEFGHFMGFTQFSGLLGPIDDPVAITSGRFDGAMVDMTSDGTHAGDVGGAALMWPFVSRDSRRLVSEVDLAVAAELSGFSEINWDLLPGDAVGDFVTPTTPSQVPLPGSLPALAGALFLGTLLGARRARASRRA